MRRLEWAAIISSSAVIYWLFLRRHARPSQPPADDSQSDPAVSRQLSASRVPEPDIFLSYGRGAATPFVKKLFAQLAERGFVVFLDTGDSNLTASEPVEARTYSHNTPLRMIGHLR